MSDPAPILIFGGTFDPPHRAHVELPRQVARRLGCGRIIYVPAAINPLKQDVPPSTPAVHRLAMLRLALRDVPEAEISTIEIDRPPPSYTVDTLRELRGQLGPDAKLYLLIGADAAASFHRWRDPAGIVSLAEPVVMLRPPWTREALIEHIRREQGDAAATKWATRIIETPQLDVSATNLRAGAAHGTIAADEVDPRVLAYIREHGLYRGNALH